MEIFREVLRDFERDKAAAARELRARKELLYARLPRVKAIDEKMSNLGLKLARLMLRDGEAAKIAALRQENDALVKEREALLYENGYDEAFFTDAYKCAYCEDSGFAGDEHCHCLKQRVLARYFEMSNLGKILDHENFDAFNINYYADRTDPAHGISPRANMERVWDICLKFEQNFGKKFENLYFYGETGLGKTFLSNCIARELLNKGHTVIYTTAAQLFRQVEDIRFNRDKTRAQALIAAIYEVDLLIIDDLGTEFITTVTASELFSFINTRLINKKPTIISTNLSPADLEDNYYDRITSRILGEYTTLHFIGEDIRVAKKYGIIS
ncbi:MAG: ATP-binding protein [Clostridiales bacterium]|jgi:DNA replication protein DnaC|nr:ATP-binding protein [Clostridiales bacterium]